MGNVRVEMASFLYFFFFLAKKLLSNCLPLPPSASRYRLGSTSTRTSIRIRKAINGGVARGGLGSVSHTARGSQCFSVLFQRDWSPALLCISLHSYIFLSTDVFVPFSINPPIPKTNECVSISNSDTLPCVDLHNLLPVSKSSSGLTQFLFLDQLWLQLPSSQAPIFLGRGLMVDAIYTMDLHFRLTTSLCHVFSSSLVFCSLYPGPWYLSNTSPHSKGSFDWPSALTHRS